MNEAKMGQGRLAALLPARWSDRCEWRPGRRRGPFVARDDAERRMAGILAFAPGSMETMVTVALSLKVNASYVAVHHIARIVGLVAVLPLLDRWLFGRDARAEPDETPDS